MAGIFQEFDQYDALGLAELVRQKKVKPVELVETVIDRIERINPTLNCVNIKTYEMAREQADIPLPDGPFAGLPWLLKDIAVFYEGVKTTSGCRYTKDFIAPGDSAVATRIKKAGMILMGKTTTPEWGLTVSTESVLWGDTRNPWNLEHVAGGSSGGSAAAVAARVVPMADASDGGGSIRIPASNCGLVGLKPSRGRVPVGPFMGDFWYGGAIFNCVSLTVRDMAAYLDVVSGPLTGDPYQPGKPQLPFLEEVSASPDRLKIGFFTKGFPGIPVSSECVAAVEETVRLCSELGHDVMEMDFSFDIDAFFDVFTRTASVCSAAAISGLEMVTGRPATEAEFEKLTWEIIETGRQITGVEHASDIEAFRMSGRQITQNCEGFDIVITPTMPNPPLKLGAFNQNRFTMEEIRPVLSAACCFTAPFNVSGQPAVSLPMHWSKDGLPVGVQFIGSYGDEAVLIRLAAQIEQARPWIDRKPDICA